MVKHKKILIFILLITFWTRLESQEAIATTQLCDNSNTAFQHGEELVYALYYNWNFVWIPAGRLTFRVKEHKATYQIEVIGKTLDSYKWFYEVDDHYSAVINKSDLRPIWFRRDIKEGNYSILNQIVFDYSNSKIYSSLTVNNKAEKNYTFPIESCILDLLSLCYNLRNIDLEELKRLKLIEVNLVFDEKIYRIPFRYVGEEQNKKVRNLGSFDIIKVSPDLISGHIFNEDSNMTLWVSNDSNRIPLMIESPIKVGNIKAILKDYKNIRHDWGK